ncbi:protein MAIN-LIKE 2-like [Gastrolobium bilobum]|uniref:protein MAIN-LIKE 2-like n=1 Tax=Gastrolobium bilobum TaxID=150636 RepID=UPI002AAFC927|nr:protein MAIN-LIKE 2-like [Gastrolobium bilobum]
MASHGLCIDPSSKEWGVLDQDVQQSHRSHVVWNDRHLKSMRVRRLPIDHRLITVLVERWRPETHTFHMPIGEMIVNLQDVEAILGLATEGRVVFSYTHGNWEDVIQQYMRLSPFADDLDGGNLKMNWLTHHWAHWVEHSATHEGQIGYTRAYLMCLFGGFFMCDKSSSVVACRYIQLLDGGFEDTHTYS